MLPQLKATTLSPQSQTIMLPPEMEHTPPTYQLTFHKALDIIAESLIGLEIGMTDSVINVMMKAGAAICVPVDR